MTTRLPALVRTAWGLPWLVLLTAACATSVIVIAMVRPHSRSMDRVIAFWARRFMAIAPGRMVIRGQEKIEPDQQYVFIANHLSNFDIPAMLIAAGPRIRFLAKAELFAIPIFGAALRRVGVVRIDRGAGPAAHASINEGVEMVKANGYSLIIFPEGTRSKTGEFEDFKKGAFRIAIASGLPVVPVTLEGTWELWKPGEKVIHPGTVHCVIHDPIPTDGLATRDIADLRDRTHAVIGDTYAVLRSG